MPNLDLFIKNVIYLRKKNGINQTKLAQLLNTNRSVIGSYEQRIAKPSIEVLMMIHELFKVDIRDLLYTPLEVLDDPHLGYNEEIIKLSKKLNSVYNEIKKLQEK